MGGCSSASMGCAPCASRSLQKLSLPCRARSVLATRRSPAVSAFWRNYALAAVGLEWYTSMQRTLHPGVPPVNARGRREPAGIITGACRFGASVCLDIGCRALSFAPSALLTTASSHAAQAPYLPPTSPMRWSLGRTLLPASQASCAGCPPRWRPSCRQACGTTRCPGPGHLPGESAQVGVGGI